MKKKGFEFGFSWIFAIIAGAVILFSAIYVTVKLVGTERKVSDTFVASELSNLLNPIETNLEDSKYVKVKFATETKVFNECSESGPFGKQLISTSSKLGIGNKFGEKSVRKSSFNKYIFSRNVEEGKELNAIVKPFEMPYKVADLTFLYEGNYCFVNPSSDIEDEIEDLSAGGNIDVGINISTSLSGCPVGFVKVCFNQLGCEIVVNTLREVVTKNGIDVHYDGNLIYGAIFSEPEIYECQIKRLSKRAGELAAIYADKSAYLEGTGCSNNLENDLRNLAVLSNVEDSEEFSNVFAAAAKSLGGRNDAISKCKVF